jgi:integrase
MREPGTSAHGGASELARPLPGPREDVKRAFDKARDAAGISDVWFHDLRRTFITQSRWLGIPESVVMRMSGHRTREVFDRYNVVSEEDLRTAVGLIEKHQQDFGHVLDTVAQNAKEAPAPESKSSGNSGAS